MILDANKKMPYTSKWWSRIQWKKLTKQLWEENIIDAIIYYKLKFELPIWNMCKKAARKQITNAVSNISNTLSSKK